MPARRCDCLRQGWSFGILRSRIRADQLVKGVADVAILKDFTVGFYRIPLPTVLSDSTHGEIAAFELVTIRVRDADGAEGAGYTYTVGRNGGAIADILKR
jgi:hypothetical protein